MNYFIGNLAVADIIIGVFSIPFQFQSALLQRWNLADFMCPTSEFFATLSVSVSTISCCYSSFIFSWQTVRRSISYISRVKTNPPVLKFGKNSTTFLRIQIVRVLEA